MGRQRLVRNALIVTSCSIISGLVAAWLVAGALIAPSPRAVGDPPVDLNANEVELADWKVVKPSSNPDTIDQQIADQEAAACGIVTAVQERMSADRWHEVLGSMLLGETKYIGSAGPEIGTSALVDWREWLDAVDERGLVLEAMDLGMNIVNGLHEFLNDDPEFAAASAASKVEILDGNIGYIRISGFNQSTARTLRKKIKRTLEVLESLHALDELGILLCGFAPLACRQLGANSGCRVEGGDTGTAGSDPFGQVPEMALNHPAAHLPSGVLRIVL